MSFYTKRVGIESLTPSEELYWKNKGTTYRPILEYKPLTASEEKRLKDEYYVKNNRVGFEKLYSSVRTPNGLTATGKEQYSPTIRQVQAWLTQQTAAQDFKPVKQPKDTKPIIVSKVNDLVQMDYMVMTSDMKYNGYSHILNCIDVLSKRAYSRTIRLGAGHDPTALQTLGLAKQIFNEIKKKEGKFPNRVQTDNGPHFLAEFEQSYRPGGDLEDIKYAAGMRYRATSQSVVERFNQTMRNMIRRFVASGTKNWPAQLQTFVTNYNTNIHSTIRMKPDDAHDGNLQDAKERIKARAKMLNHNTLTLDKGDKVRLVNFKKMKSSQYKDEPNWWPEVYSIFHVVKPKDPTHPQRYMLEPNPPTTIVGNRPGYRGPNAKGRRQFSVYELLMLARKGEKHWDDIKVSTTIEVMGKVAEESDEEEEPDAQGIPTNSQKPNPSAAAAAGKPVQPPTPVLKVKPMDLVGKFLRVKWDSKGPLTVEHVEKEGTLGQFYKCRVSSYDPDTFLHKVQYVSDGKIEEHNMFNKNRPGFIQYPQFWKIDKK